MKVVFDTNLFIGLIRDGRHQDLFCDPFMTRYVSSVVLMELWAGAVSKRAARSVEQLQSPYIRADRVVHPSAAHFIAAGQFLSDLPARHRPRAGDAGFVNDLLIALSAKAVGAVLYTQNRRCFTLVSEFLSGLQLVFVE